MRNRRLFVLFLSICMLFPLLANSFVKVKNGHFYQDGKPYYFIGTNLWYAPILASEGTGGDRERLKSELDMLQSLGINNTRWSRCGECQCKYRTALFTTSSGMY